MCLLVVTSVTPSRLTHGRPSLPSREAEASNQPRVVPPPLIKPSSFARFPLPREHCPVHTSPFLHHGGRNGLRVQFRHAWVASPSHLPPVPFPRQPLEWIFAGLGVLCIFAPAVADQRPRQNPTTPPLFCAQHNIPQERTYSGRASTLALGDHAAELKPTVLPRTFCRPSIASQQQPVSHPFLETLNPSTLPFQGSPRIPSHQRPLPQHTPPTLRVGANCVRRQYLLANPYDTSRNAFLSGACPADCREQAVADISITNATVSVTRTGAGPPSPAERLCRRTRVPAPPIPAKVPD